MKKNKELISLTKFWNKKKVFITGHSGFKGTWLCIILNMLKSEIASAHWGKDEAIGIRLHYDNQVMSALNYFNEAAKFINNSQ